MSAALAYYAIFAMAPLFIILIFLVGLVYQGDTLDRAHYRVAEFAGPDAADLITEAVVQASRRLEGGGVYTAVAVLLVVVGVSALSNKVRVSIYGAAGSLMVLLAWVYYSSAILLFGAEFMQVFAERRGGRFVPRAKGG